MGNRPSLERSVQAKHKIYLQERGILGLTGSARRALFLYLDRPIKAGPKFKACASGAIYWEDRLWEGNKPIKYSIERSKVKKSKPNTAEIHKGKKSLYRR